MSAEQIANWGGYDARRWRKLVGCTLHHKTFADGTLVNVLDAGHVLWLWVEHGEDALKQYEAGKFQLSFRHVEIDDAELAFVIERDLAKQLIVPPWKAPLTRQPRPTSLVGVTARQASERIGDPSVDRLADLQSESVGMSVLKAPYIDRKAYYMTALGNLPSILRDRCIWSDREIEKRGIVTESIAYKAIKEIRRNRQVDCVDAKASGGRYVVADFVPFYFCFRSPMLYAIHRKCVRKGLDQRSVVYLVITVRRAMERAGRVVCISDGHSVTPCTRFVKGSDGLGKLDWDVIDDLDWANTEDDDDRKRRKQAELLVLSHYPIEDVNHLACSDNAIAARVRQMIKDSGLDLKVEIRPKWYYD